MLPQGGQTNNAQEKTIPFSKVFKGGKSKIASNLFNI